MLTLIASIVVFCLLIFIHELGHFLAAKSVGVTVHEFAIGMGPKLFGFNGKETTVCKDFLYGDYTVHQYDEITKKGKEIGNYCKRMR